MYLIVSDTAVGYAHLCADESRDLLLLWHSRPGGQNNKGAQWSVPEWWEGPVPPELAARADELEVEGTRIPGSLLRHEPAGGGGGASATTAAKL